MKSIFTLLVFLSLSLIATALHAQAADPVKMANRSNEKKTDEGVVNEDVAAFLVQSADARMMDKTEGAMAAKKGTTSAIRQYGQLMVKDQTLLLSKIKSLAATKKISLPAGISNKK